MEWMPPGLQDEAAFARLASLELVAQLQCPEGAAAGTGWHGGPLWVPYALTVCWEAARFLGPVVNQLLV